MLFYICWLIPSYQLDCCLVSSFWNTLISLSGNKVSSLSYFVLALNFSRRWRTRGKKHQWSRPNVRLVECLNLSLFGFMGSSCSGAALLLQLLHMLSVCLPPPPVLLLYGRRAPWMHLSLSEEDTLYKWLFCYIIKPAEFTGCKVIQQL